MNNITIVRAGCPWGKQGWAALSSANTGQVFYVATTLVLRTESITKNWLVVPSGGGGGYSRERAGPPLSAWLSSHTPSQHSSGVRPIGNTQIYWISLIRKICHLSVHNSRSWEIASNPTSLYVTWTPPLFWWRGLSSQGPPDNQRYSDSLFLISEALPVEI